MSFASMGEGEDNEALAEINMVPLIDVMLVLLVIFIVTAPLLTHAVKVDLPKVASTPNLIKPESVQIAIDARGQLFWNAELIDVGALASHLQTAAAQSPQPELQLRAERTTPYEKVAEVIAASARAGLTRIGFVTEPKAP